VPGVLGDEVLEETETPGKQIMELNLVVVESIAEAHLSGAESIGVKATIDASSACLRAIVASSGSVGCAALATGGVGVAAVPRVPLPSHWHRKRLAPQKRAQAANVPSLAPSRRSPNSSNEAEILQLNDETSGPEANGEKRNAADSSDAEAIGEKRSGSKSRSKSKGKAKAKAKAKAK